MIKRESNCPKPKATTVFFVKNSLIKSAMLIIYLPLTTEFSLPSKYFPKMGWTHKNPLLEEPKKSIKNLHSSFFFLFFSKGTLCLHPKRPLLQLKVQKEPTTITSELLQGKKWLWWRTYLSSANANGDQKKWSLWMWGVSKSPLFGDSFLRAGSLTYRRKAVGDCRGGIYDLI